MRLKVLRLGDFNQHICDVVWPPLEILELGNKFNHPVEETSWPTTLRSQSLGYCFCQPLDAVTFPEGLAKLTLGNFNHPVDAVIWPPGLKVLNLGNSFNQPIAGVEWPPGLQALNLGLSFDQPLAEYVVISVIQPSALETDTPNKEGYPGMDDRVRYADVAWPPRWQSKKLGGFSHAVLGVTFPAGLQTLDLGLPFKHPIKGVQWPEGLETLNLGGSFNRPLREVMCPTGLKTLSLGYCFDQALDGVAWPDGIRELIFGIAFDHSIEEGNWPRELRHIDLGWDFSQPIDKVRWPDYLKTLTLEDGLSCGVADVTWPRRLRTLQVGNRIISDQLETNCFPYYPRSDNANNSPSCDRPQRMTDRLEEDSIVSTGAAGTDAGFVMLFRSRVTAVADDEGGLMQSGVDGAAEGAKFARGLMRLLSSSHVSWPRLAYDDDVVLTAFSVGNAAFAPGSS